MDQGRLQVTESMECKTVGKGGALSSLLIFRLLPKKYTLRCYHNAVIECTVLSVSDYKLLIMF